MIHVRSKEGEIRVVKWIIMSGERYIGARYMEKLRRKTLGYLGGSKQNDKDT